MLSARFELAIFRVSGERIDQLSHESELIEQLVDAGQIFWYLQQQKQCIIAHAGRQLAVVVASQDMYSSCILKFNQFRVHQP